MAQRRQQAAPEVVDLTVDDDEDEDDDAQPGAAQPAAPPLLEELRGDLFSVDARVSLAHCVARDLRLGKGVP